MRHKSETFDRIKEFRTEVENQLGKVLGHSVKTRGGEYLSNEFLGYLVKGGILSQWTPPGTPLFNGVSGPRNRTLLIWSVPC